MREVKTIVIHCTATRPNWMAEKTSDQRWAEIKRWHVSDRGWSDIGYHWGIDRDGTLHRGRPSNRIGAHTRGENRNSIGIVLFGGHGARQNDSFIEHFTHAQDRKLLQLIEAILKEFTSIDRIAGHNEFAAKACPGFSVPKYYDIKDLK